uniref:Uncharacterized protein n=1 Tax=Ciona intestinalis TaxID=7719 RepID=H2XUM7_CIOIN
MFGVVAKWLKGAFFHLRGNDFKVCRCYHCGRCASYEPHIKKKPPKKLPAKKHMVTRKLPRGL